MIQIMQQRSGPERTFLSAFALLILAATVLLNAACKGDDGRSNAPARKPVAAGDLTQPKGTTGPGDEIRAADLPAEARQTLLRIKLGGPFPYRKDGAVFGNRESLLPPGPRG